MSVSARQQRSSNSQAVKAILTQLYVAWASEPENTKLLKGKIQEFLGTAQTSASKSATNGRYADPNSGLTSSDGREAAPADSPPATPPSKPLKGKNRPEELRTPSPSPSAAAGGTGAGPNPFRGVDELDYPHRSGSPGVAPSSPRTKPVVDPSAPLPQLHGVASGGGNSPLSSGTTSSSSFAANAGSVSPSGANTVSPPGAHSLGSSSLDTTLNAAMVDVMPTNVDLNATINKDPSVGRFVHSTGGYAVRAPANARRASLKDIPVFYTRKDSNGALGDLPSDETGRLAELLGEKTAGSSVSSAAGSSAANKSVRKAAFGDISVQVFKVPIWMKDMLFEAIVHYVGAPAKAETLTQTQVSKFYNEKLGRLTPSRRLFELIRGTEDTTREFLTIDDLKALVKYLVAAHPGLEFLQQPEFQDYYCRTVAIRIMYALERQQNRKIYWRDFDRSDLPEVMVELDSKDVNQVLEYFSYEHFYVLYCKFWELDTDRDLFVDYSDLCNYGQGSVVSLVIRRVVDGYGRPLTSGQPGRLDFEDFVYFCLSEEDKNSEPAVYYWFKVLDVDGDGILSGYELMEFYKENQQRFLDYSESVDGDIAYEDTMCQMLDMLGFDRVKTRKYGVTLGDLRACPTPANFFNMIFNAPKFMLFEHRDPFSEHQQKLRPEKTDWDRFARIEYDRMAAEAQ